MSFFTELPLGAEEHLLLTSNNWNYIVAIFGYYESHILLITAVSLLFLDFKGSIFIEMSCRANSKVLYNIESL